MTLFIGLSGTLLSRVWLTKVTLIGDIWLVVQVGPDVTSVLFRDIAGLAMRRTGVTESITEATNSQIFMDFLYSSEAHAAWPRSCDGDALQSCAVRPTERAGPRPHDLPYTRNNEGCTTSNAYGNLQNFTGFQGHLTADTSQPVIRDGKSRGVNP